MGKQELVGREDWIEEIIGDKDRFIQGIKNSPAVIRKNREAVEQLSNLKSTSRWEDKELQKAK